MEHIGGGEPEHSGRGFRHRKTRLDPMCCPICGITLRSQEIDHHFAVEVDRLERILKPKKNLPYAGGCDDGSSAGPSTSNGDGRRHNHSPSEPGSSSSALSRSNGHCGEERASVGPDECWGTYQKIKNNRQARLKLKSRKRKPEDNVCPVCNKVTLEDIAVHVESCLRKSESQRNGSDIDDEDDDDDASIDVEEVSFETYEWAGQKRIRSTSLLGAGTLASVAVRVTNADDTDDELNVDGDESQVYGPPQYCERDVIVSSDGTASGALRELVIANEPHTVKPPDSPGEGTSKATGVTSVSYAKVDDGGIGVGDMAGSVPVLSNSSDRAIVESLKAKVREYEGYIRNRPKCLICMDDFRKPVVSVCCWHVYCEECWLHTLGARKLCPQCSMITSPTDLRRIYL
ncbi:E3 ubiquitin-protein ligase Rnf220 [Anopheles cruzii]|uniref:E3 ubiquitin-protein ligase Rnf220 n=1 Tax=Anopheles cruzii TaxID=68878 RepID=UPI0022EC9548|nr:E3 ubiquitin-protein ligase Rnf220 [Anopheles cruzii]